MDETTPKKKRGLANVSPEKRREIASKGGKAAKNRHKFTSEEARAAGWKGGMSILASKGREHFAEIGRKGGLARWPKEPAE